MINKILEFFGIKSKEEEVNDSKVPAAWPFPVSDNRPSAPVTEAKPKAKAKPKAETKKAPAKAKAKAPGKPKAKAKPKAGTKKTSK
jgi:hypothetical protein